MAVVAALVLLAKVAVPGPPVWVQEAGEASLPASVTLPLRVAANGVVRRSGWILRRPPARERGRG